MAESLSSEDDLILKIGDLANHFNAITIAGDLPTVHANLLQ